MGLGRVKKRLEKFKAAADIDTIFKELVLHKEFQQLAIELNTKGQPTSQLFEQGVDSLSVSLGEYAGTTIEGTSSFEGKREKGQRFDHITLEDTGKFYASFKILTGGNAFLFKIEANPNRDDTNLFDDFGKEILGWTDQNLQILINWIRERIVPLIKTKMAA